MPIDLQSIETGRQHLWPSGLEYKESIGTSEKKWIKSNENVEWKNGKSRNSCSVETVVWELGA